MIFVVDDSDTNLTFAEEALEDDYDVMTMPSAAKMFTLLEKFTPELILLDIEMPGMNGFEALERLKSSAAWAEIPVMFLTGYLDAAIEDKGAKLGALGFITKPFSKPALLERIGAYVTKSQ